MIRAIRTWLGQRRDRRLAARIKVQAAAAAVAYARGDSVAFRQFADEARRLADLRYQCAPDWTLQTR